MVIWRNLHIKMWDLPISEIASEGTEGDSQKRDVRLPAGNPLRLGYLWAGAFK